MKKIFITRGMPLSGKTTFLRDHGLTPWVTSADDLRGQVSSPVEILNRDGDGYAFSVEHANEKLVWDMIYQIVEHKMQRYETIIVDATHLFKGASKHYRELATKYQYKLYGVDFTINPETGEIYSVEELQARNALRPERQVSLAVIKDYVQRAHKGIGLFDLPIISPQEMLDMLPAQKTDLASDYHTVKIIGDIHGDYGAFQKIFDDHVKGTAYVLVGDYFDRGTKNVEVFEFLERLRAKNIFLLRGNHEIHLDSWTMRHLKRGRLFGSVTLIEFLRAGINDDRMRHLTKRLKDYLYFDFDVAGKRQTFYVSHAGFEPIQVDRFKAAATLENSSVYYMGLGSDVMTPYDRDIDKLWRETMPADQINVHGHRNKYHDAVEGSNSFNLTEDGELRWIEITHDGISYHSTSSVDGGSLVAELFEDPDIFSKELENGITVHNFTREVFTDGRWTPTTTVARGLFTKDNAIIGRGFDKFFNVDERGPIDSLDTLQFPVKVYQKYNGFLGIVFYDKAQGAIVVMSKGGGELHSGFAREILKSSEWWPRLEDYYADVQDQDSSVLFEVIDPINDPHIVKYDHAFAVPIAVIDNATGAFNVSGEETFNIQPDLVVDDLEGLNRLLEENQDTTQEGFVFRGLNKQLKWKSPFYLKAKELRGALELGRHKKNWWHGAEDWYLRDRRANFTPDLALTYWQQDHDE